MNNVITITAEKEKLVNTLSDQFSQNLITIEEYEKMLEWVNKVETGKELMAVRSMVNYDSKIDEKKVKEPLGSEPPRSKATSAPAKKPAKSYLFSRGKTKEYASVFSHRNITVVPENGKAGKFSCVFGTMKINVDEIPEGKTVLKVESVFSSMEIFVPENIKVINDVSPVFGGVFDEKENDYYDNSTVLHIKGEAVFGSIFIKRV